MNPRFLLKYVLVLLSLLWYVLLYYYIERSEFIFLISGILILGGIYFYWLKIDSFNIKEIVVIAIVFRASLLVDIPNFSDDCYRFVWDGKIMNEVGNPYEYTPTQVLNATSFSSEKTQELYTKLNSKDYYTVYPPANQFLFSTSVFIGGGRVSKSIFCMKLLILLFEIGLLFLLFKLLRKLKLKESLAQIYAFNPLVVIELTGNIHFEGIMLFFFLWGIYLIYTNRLLIASVCIGVAISVKLIPLLFLPLFLPLLGIKKSIKLYLGIGLTFMLLLVPFITQTLIDNFGESLNLYFQSFEFNASLYYLFKGISHLFLGYKTNLIGIITPTVIFCLAILFTLKLYRKKQLNFQVTLFVKYASLLLFIFYLLSSTIHPWYVINLVFLSVFIPQRTYLVWSILVFISYFAYSTYVENYAPEANFHSYFWYYLLIGIEYCIVLIFFIFENRRLNNRNKLIQ